MRHTGIGGRALRLAIHPSRQPYVCRACLAQASRQFTTFTPRSADKPFWKQLQNTFFGSKERKKAEQSREEKNKKRREDSSSRRDAVTRIDHSGQVYEVADAIEWTAHPGYKEASSWDGLDRVGGERWVKERADQGEKYRGFLPQMKFDFAKLPVETLLRNVAEEVVRDKTVTVDLDMSVRDPSVKFAIVKRTMELTGKRTSDPAISRAETLGDISSAFEVEEKPEKLAESKEMQVLRDSLPNVKVHHKRQTPVHKEKAIGRWKVIEQELTFRNLPVFGTTYPDAQSLKNFRR